MKVEEYIRYVTGLYARNVEIIDIVDREKINELIMELASAINKKDTDYLYEYVPLFQRLEQSFKPGGPSITNVMKNYQSPIKNEQFMSKAI